MTPALQMRMSRRSDWEMTSFAAFSTDANDVRSHSRNTASTEGAVDLIAAVICAACVALRPLK